MLVSITVIFFSTLKLKDTIVKGCYTVALSLMEKEREREYLINHS